MLDCCDCHDITIIYQNYLYNYICIYTTILVILKYILVIDGLPDPNQVRVYCVIMIWYSNILSVKEHK